jgi:dTDP-4-dehydrorhamnose reductase
VSLERVLVTGGGGQLATDLDNLLDQRCDHVVLSIDELDISRDEQVKAALAEHDPAVVINCAAFHNVDECEREGAQAFAVNALAVKELAEACAARGAKLVHFSTNYVFDGRREEPYGEEDHPNPRSVYAVSKLAGEHMAVTYDPSALVIRTAGLYGQAGSASKGGNFIARILSRAEDQGRLQVVADQLLSPTFTADLASAVIEAIEADAAAIVHLTASGSCSWHEFAATIVSLAGVDVPVERVDTTLPPGVADRPLNGVLARPRADALGLTPLRHWRDALADYLERAGLVVNAS